MLKYALILLFCWSNIHVYSQQKAVETGRQLTETENKTTAEKYASTIMADDIRKHLSVLASDEYEGRETGTEGNEKAAKYIANYFQQLRFPYSVNNDSYFQPVNFTWIKWDKANITVNGRSFRHLWDFMTFPSQSESIEFTEGDELLFLGHGIDSEEYSDYKGVDVKGKLLLIYEGEPKDDKGNYIISGSSEPSSWQQADQKKIQLAKEKGAKAVFIIIGNLQKVLSQYRSQMTGPTLSLGKKDELQTAGLPYAYISTNIARELMGSKKKKVIKSRDKVKKGANPKAVKLKTNWSFVLEKNVRTLEGKNVLGFLEGSDPELKDEIVVMSAHYDHLGKRNKDIYNGADDNGSGTSTVLDIAEAFMTAKREGKGPRRSILFLLLTGEEKGLLGSKFYVENPVYPLEQTIADVNVDMIGRIDDKHTDGNYIYVIGSDRLSSELHEINETANEQYENLDLDYTYNAKDDPNRYYYRSDHYNFAERGIPAIFFFSGVHEDYHRTTDTIEKIMFDKTAKIGRHIFYTTWELANRDKRIEVDVLQE